MNRKSYLIAGAIVLALALWLGSGYLGGETRGSVTEAPAEQAAEPIAVQVRVQTAEPVARRLEAHGQVMPNRVVEVRAETTGSVAEVLVDKGQRVEAGDPLARIAMNDREARLEQAKARVAQYRGDYEAARRLGNKGFQSSSTVRESYAGWQAARAELAAVEEDIENTTVRAPFDGVVDELPVNVGDYLSPGDPVATVVDNDPLKVVVHIAQQDIDEVTAGGPAEVSLVGGKTLEGTVSYVSATADQQTRTFRVEVHIPNPGDVRSGMSATARLPIGSVSAHFLSPAFLALNEDGVLGVKTVDEDGRVGFEAISIVRAELNGMWVTGLPKRARIITVGQGFVQSGEPVSVVLAEESPITLNRPAGPSPAAAED